MGLFGFFKSNNSREVEEKILSCDAGNIEWDELEEYLRSRGISESDYQKIRLEAHRKNANAGNAFSQRIYGMLLRYGYGGNRDKKKAEYWYTLSAEQGDVEAMSALASAYSEAENEYDPEASFGRNPEKELYWINRWASSGSIKGIVALAKEYYSGDIVKEDVSMAQSLLERAANVDSKESAEACIELGKEGAFPGINVQTRMVYLKRAIGLIANYWINKANSIQSVRPDIPAFAVMIHKKGYDDQRLLDKAVCELGKIYDPSVQGGYKDARLSAYYYSMSYNWGSETYGEEYTIEIIRKTGYKTQNGEREKWCADAKSLRILL